MDKVNSTDWLEVMARLQRGDRLALIQVTRLITGYLTRYRAYQLRDSWDDLVQEVLIALIKSMRKQQIQHANAFVSYVGTITRNKLVDWLHSRSRAGSDELLGEADVAQAILDKSEADDSARRNEELLDLQTALDALPERERKAVTAIYIQGHSYEEAAAALNLPLGTLKRLQTQGLKLLRQNMQINPGDKSTGRLSDSGGSADLPDEPAAYEPDLPDLKA